ncbi:hypothetical protein PMAYCL1PPCAC_17308, partial [Pristionchus mayeri]
IQILPLVAGQVANPDRIEPQTVDVPSSTDSSVVHINDVVDVRKREVVTVVEGSSPKIVSKDDEEVVKRFPKFSGRHQETSDIEGSGEIDMDRVVRQFELGDEETVTTTPESDLTVKRDEGLKRRPFATINRKESTVVEGSGEEGTTREERDTEMWIIPNDEVIASQTTENYAATTLEDEVRANPDAVEDRANLMEGSGDFERIRNVRQAEAAVVLGSEKPVEVGMQKRPEDRHRPSSPRPELTCETVDCIRGMQCVMENGRPTCQSFPTPSTPSEQRSCRDISCHRGTRCRMVRDDRCRGRDCSEQPICVREERDASCSRVQCPSGTRCVVRDEPGCFGRFCREVATCVNPCDGVRCPFGTSCRFDGRDAICNPIVINPCLSVRCPNGFECRAVQNQPQCFAISTPAPTLPPTTPSPCSGQNEEFASCATFCEPNCVEKNPACILACAAPRCQCANGFYRNQQGVCVPSEQCDFTPSCGLNESFMECSTLCEPRCGQPVNIACPAMCGPAKCQCKEGFWRHQSGSCVQQNQCFFG